MIIEAWTDGSGTTKGPGGWAYVLRAIDHKGEILKEREGCGSAPEATNNRMELRAAIEALAAVTAPSSITVCTDSEYVANAFSKGWLDGWKKNGWRTSSSAARRVPDPPIVQCPMCGTITREDPEDPVCFAHDPATYRSPDVDRRMVRNRDLWLELDFLVEFHSRVVFKWVPGHSGMALNERCDKLAGEERRRLIEAIDAGDVPRVPAVPVIGASALF